MNYNSTEIYLDILQHNENYHRNLEHQNDKVFTNDFT